MGRTSDAKIRLIEAVIELIWTGSYGSTSVDQICERAGVKKGSFYHFFESKTDLAIIGIEHSWLEHRRELDQTFSPVVPPLDRILNCFRNFRKEQEELLAKHGRVLGCPVHSLGAEISTVDDRLRNKLQEILSQFILYYECAVRDADAQGIIDAPDPNAIARIVFAYSEGLLLHARMWNDLSYLDEFEAGAMIILGVTQRTPRGSPKATKATSKKLSALSN
ncbi:TetR family transcriptional regulator [Prosthecobacter fusiformis]|uniref:TetR family transcriptional regulator n=1 Tax=Prosthecobacter fusiformis TaxID=48464 RepID=A0A4R7RXJ9_9BACT|nr:TetR/AcrR family transcriptional regulator [Prosthecobacter fusiformis]TDU70604.1 TetR family transcriptional regulator [Prosthecobacter fusiformis]